MKKFIAGIAIATALATPVIANEDHQHGNSAQGKDKPGGMMMDQAQMMKMHEHMHVMKEMMTEIKQETNMAKRQALMEKSMAEMEAHMTMMMPMGASSNSQADHAHD
ncbi:hypothetical protein IIE18_11910 [Pseudomonas sp. V1]|uniref:hypothetical protein n=1 Tax=Pseudomonas arcuscaelestis TaxID=2710591 RepID=UPI00193FB947|nr:hypothetical protein [Pseudomonas arcuscaelestis]MBM3105844.1 hypothetical protein [Pseudomonas arcuscaelestis]